MLLEHEPFPTCWANPVVHILLPTKELPGQLLLDSSKHEQVWMTFCRKVLPGQERQSRRRWRRQKSCKDRPVCEHRHERGLPVPELQLPPLLRAHREGHCHWHRTPRPPHLLQLPNLPGVEKIQATKLRRKDRSKYLSIDTLFLNLPMGSLSEWQ